MISMIKVVRWAQCVRTWPMEDNMIAMLLQIGPKQNKPASKFIILIPRETKIKNFCIFVDNFDDY